MQRCPAQCIRMEEDAEGFAYPVVDADACIGCGACEKVCPMLRPAETRPPRRTLAARCPDERMRLRSSSGGIFPLLAGKILDEGGAVFGAAFTSEWEVVHRTAERPEELDALCGSKYVQSAVADTYRQAEKLLRAGRRVLFTGTPCQIAGLHGYLGRGQYPGLLTAECLCHGAPSPGVWRRYVREAEKEGRIEEIRFRDKSTGWRNYSVVFSTASGERRMPHRECLYMRGFLRDLYLRPSCYECRFKCGKSGSDLTLGDLWGVERALPFPDDDKGVSLVLVNTPAGAEAFDALPAQTAEVDLAAAARSNGGFSERIPVPAQRAAFFRRLDTAGRISELIRRHLKPSLPQRLARSIRKIFHR